MVYLVEHPPLKHSTLLLVYPSLHITTWYLILCEYLCKLKQTKNKIKKGKESIIKVFPYL